LKKLDIYIIKTFLTTFFATIGLFAFIIIVFDLGEKLDDFMGNNIPAKVVIFDYYVNFIPFIINTFSPVFVFITVIFFTSQIAQRTEFIAMLSSGISYVRILRPYLITAVFLGLMTFMLNSWIIPRSDKKRVIFENTYIRDVYNEHKESIHRQLSPDMFISIGWFSFYDSSGSHVTLEKYDSGKLVSKTYARRISYNSENKKWKLKDVFTRDFLEDGSEVLTKHHLLDTTLHFNPDEFFRKVEDMQAFNYVELNHIIAKEKARGSETVHLYTTEKYKRFGAPFTLIILSLLGVFVSSKKSRGGLGLNLGVGILMTFGLLFLIQFFNSYAIMGIMSPAVAIAIPNLIYGVVALLMYRRVQK
jgi:lipopolysaccharide export system permease protein